MTLDNFLLERRDFLKLAGAATLCSVAPNAVAAPSQRVTLLVDPQDPVVSAASVKRAIDRLREALTTRHVSCELIHSLDQAHSSTLCIVVAGEQSSLTRSFPQGKTPKEAESFRIAPGKLGQTTAILISAKDALGFIYPLLELSERAQHSDSPVADLAIPQEMEEAPANKFRSVSRYFCSELEDKPWYYDKEFWPGYLDALVSSRFNRFTFAYGLAYDFPKGVTGDYLHFVYPYLFEVPGYEQVRVLQLATPDGKRLSSPIPLSQEERAKNLEALQFIASETAARGLHFQLGIWTHAYQWTDSPNAYHRIEGLTPQTHATYCRDALALLLKKCPQIEGLTMRVHGESGIPEGSYGFWKTLFEAISECGRTVEIDMHAKGVDQKIIDIAAQTGMPVKLGAKYSAEHQSLGYNQADIRALEIPHAKLPAHNAALFSVSNGARLFTRYGYGDFLHVGSRYKLWFRLWPGTQRHLLSADPEMAAAYSRTSSFCGAVGIDLMEPLTFKGREGSGNPGGRCAYADRSLNPRFDWEKFHYYYRVWGRKLYNPDTPVEALQRPLKAQLGSGADSLGEALANASRILALVTSAHLSSASNHSLWVELPDNMPIVLGSERSPYGDTPVPKCFGTVSPLDPQLFSTVVEFTEALLAGNPSAKYSPIEVAQWLEDFADASEQALGQSEKNISDAHAPQLRRIKEDILIQIGLGRFFAGKLRSAALYDIYERTGQAQAGQQALDSYKKARAAWAKMAARAKLVYSHDISYGAPPIRRGHWSDRIPAIDVDIAAMERKLKSPPTSASATAAATHAIRVATGRPRRPQLSCTHNPPESFHPGADLPLEIELSNSSSSSSLSVRLFFRHVDQAERWTSTEMKHSGQSYTAAIPGHYTDSIYSLQYYFELRDSEAAWLYPAFNSTLSNQPYYAIDRRTA